MPKLWMEQCEGLARDPGQGARQMEGMSKDGPQK